MYCTGDLIPAKTLCRIFAFLNLFLGLLSLYYWELMSSFTDKITYASRWDSVLLLNERIRETISEECGKDYLATHTPFEFGTLFKKSIQFYIAACIIFSIKGFFQFFVTCFNPVSARLFSYGMILVDILTTCLILYGLNLFTSPQLCLLEYTDVFYYPRRQSQMILLTIVCLAVVKPAELISLVCFICNQTTLISCGETRSKGARRSDAFRTPMMSRANSFLCGNINGAGDGKSKYICADTNNNNNNNNLLLPATVFQLINNSDDEEDFDDQQNDEGNCVTLIYVGAGDDSKHFVGIDLHEHDNENNNRRAQNNIIVDTNNYQQNQSVTILHASTTDNQLSMISSSTSRQPPVVANDDDDEHDKNNKDPC